MWKRHETWLRTLCDQMDHMHAASHSKRRCRRLWTEVGYVWKSVCVPELFYMMGARWARLARACDRAAFYTFDQSSDLNK
jgi:hypothetical protein